MFQGSNNIVRQSINTFEGEKQIKYKSTYIYFNISSHILQFYPSYFKTAWNLINFNPFPSFHSVSQQTTHGLNCLMVEDSKPHVIRHTHSVGLLWRSDQPIAEATTCTTRNKHTRRPSIRSAKFESVIPAFEPRWTVWLLGSEGGFIKIHKNDASVDKFEKFVVSFYVKTIILFFLLHLMLKYNISCYWHKR